LTKYNIGGDLPEIDASRRRILVAGQVEDDASVLMGASETRTNLELLRRARADNPDALVVWKPHPDVEAGLRQGVVDAEELARLVDLTLLGVGAAEALEATDEVWTMTSTLGFEALLRARPVTCLGMPFYAGRGLTPDLAPRPPHREGQDVSLTALVHACLIEYPRYFDPRTGAPISPEAALMLLAEGVEMPRVNKLMARIRSLF
jgi:capsular polysaccharide export protein